MPHDITDKRAFEAMTELLFRLQGLKLGEEIANELKAILLVVVAYCQAVGQGLSFPSQEIEAAVEWANELSTDIKARLDEGKLDRRLPEFHRLDRLDWHKDFLAWAEEHLPELAQAGALKVHESAPILAKGNPLWRERQGERGARRAIAFLSRRVSEGEPANSVKAEEASEVSPTEIGGDELPASNRNKLAPISGKACAPEGWARQVAPPVIGTSPSPPNPHSQAATEGESASSLRLPGRSDVKEVTWPPLPAGQATLPSFPLSSLPPRLAADVEERARQMQISVDAVVPLMLAAIGTAGAKRVWIQLGPSLHTTHLWALAPMDSGEGKSPLMESLSRPFQKIQARQQERMTEQELHHRIQARLLRKERGRLEKELLDLRSQAANEETETEDDAPRLEERLVEIERQLDVLKRQVNPTLLCEDITSQALIGLLASATGPLLLASAEGSVFFRSCGGSTVLGQQVESVLKAFSHETIHVHRVSRPSVTVAQPALGMILATQPVVIRAILRSQGFAGRGLWERFLYVSPPSMVGRRRPVGPLPSPGERPYDSLVEGLLGRPASSSPQVLSFQPQAEKLFDDYCMDIDQRMFNGDLAVEPMRGWAAKLRTNLLRLSAVLHLASEWGERESEVRPETVQGAISLLDVVVHHARYVLEQMPQEEEDETCLLRQLQQHGEPMTRRDLHRRVQVRFPKADLLHDALERLAEKGFLRVREERHPHGHPTHWIDLHPGLLRTGRAP